jgi:DNA polymerase-3 subunit delta'
MKFSEIVGQEYIKKRLLYIARHEKIPHALLFAGPEGVGKLTTALAFAQYINCQQPTPEDVCDECPSCHKFARLIHPDLHFVFPVYKGSRTSVVCDDFINEWRELVLQSSYFKSSKWYNVVAEDKGQPIIYADEALEIIRKLSVKNYEATYKVIIIYQPERLHVATANKLLKIIEEPPPYTVFILISANPEQILPTIVSRCQLINFHLIDDISIKNYLTAHFPQHKEHEIHQAVLLAGGNIPEAIKLLEIQGSTQEYFVLYQQVVRLAFEISRNKPKKDELLKWAHTIAAFSKEIQKDFLLYCLHVTRDNFLHKETLKSLLFQTKEEEDFSQNFSKFMPYETAMALNKHFSDAIHHLERNGNAKIIFTDLALLLTKYF